jgi:hypothetical protein
VKHRLGVAGLVLASILFQGLVAQSAMASQALTEAVQLYQQGMYFKAARYAFAAKSENKAIEAEADSWIALSLMKANLYHSGAYFFIKTLQSGNKPAIKRVLGETQNLLVRVGADLLKTYLIRHTKYEDYDALNRSAYLYALGKDSLLRGQAEASVDYLNGISSSSPIWPFALQIRGTARAILGKNDLAVADFEACTKKASQYVDRKADAQRQRQQKSEAEDLEARCLAGRARTLYQTNDFQSADRAFDQIPKESLVWPDTLFEAAWNSYGKQEYNRTLGKLVSYKSPALQFVYNSEIDVLRAQTYLALCLYGDVNEVINQFNGNYSKLGEDVKKFVENNSSNLGAFYAFGKDSVLASLYTPNPMIRMANRFVRGPYFRNLLDAERTIAGERVAVQRFGAMLPGVQRAAERGFPAFLDQVLSWRQKTVVQLGGAYVKNSLIDYHTALIADFEKMAFIKLDMLSKAKDKILYRRVEGERTRGGVEPSRRDDQFYWSFNGEFWNDELGDYVFGLESECRS